MNISLLEQISELEHEQWCSWVSYMLENYSEENVERWKRQLKTKYADLSDYEKQSDRRWAEKVLKIIIENE